MDKKVKLYGNFKAEETRDTIISEIKKLSESQGWSKAVIGISGGKDSTVCAALLARALGKENVYGVLIPDGEQTDIEDGYAVVKTLGINYRVCNIGAVHEKMGLAILGGHHSMDEFNVELTNESDINVVPRLRMTLLRYISQSMHARLCGTGNLSESYVGYCTKDGDTSCDFNPVGFLTSVEVVKVGLTMDELPRHLVVKTPSDGLSGVSDEVKLGVSYNDIHNYIRNNGEIDNHEAAAKIKRLHNMSHHKRHMPYRILEEHGDFKWEYQRLFW